MKKTKQNTLHLALFVNLSFNFSVSCLLHQYQKQVEEQQEEIQEMR